MKSIVIIFPYFGTLPVQYKMWRVSALQNPSIDFMFFTDTDVEPAKNIIVHKMQFADFQQIVQKAFDFPIVLDRPYKLCEYKQAYGHILKDYIKGYDFWGFGDLDLVYGDLRTFFTEEALLHKFLLGWGHLTLLRNDDDAVGYFMQHIDGYQDYKNAFTTSKITFFDEYGYNGCSDKWRDQRPQDCWLEWPFDNASKPKQSYHFNSLTRGWKQVVFEHIDNKLYMLRFHHGNLERKESLYAHFQHRGFMKDKVTNYSHFLVTPNAIIDYPKHFVSLCLRWHCRNRSLMTKYYQWKDRIIWKLVLSKTK
ncbi:MAG: hypothetical protein IJ588_01960 [Prevotella sp.]|nr:hypothetical protein [Prevotella sp.]